MSRASIWFFSVVLLLSVFVGGGALAWYKYSQIVAASTAPPPPEFPMLVRIAPVITKEYQQQTTVIGTVIAPKSVMLSNEIAGTVTKVMIAPEAKVAKGTVLVELDTSVERAQLLAAKARATIAKSNLERIVKLSSSKAVSASEAEEAEAQYQQAFAEVAQLEAIIAKKTLCAPFDAKVGLSNTHEGQFLLSGSSIVSLQSTDDYVFVDFMVPQSAADTVKIDQAVSLSNGGESIPATIVAMDSRADKMSRNIMARGKIQPVPENLVPGDSIRVTIEYGPKLSTAAVLAESIRYAPMRTFVYVAESNTKGELRAQPRNVTLGPTLGKYVTVLSGLEGTEQVVADGSFKIHDQSLIAPAPEPEIAALSPSRNGLE